MSDDQRSRFVDDAPVLLGAALELRRTQVAVAITRAPVDLDLEGAVAFALALPAIEVEHADTRVRRHAPTAEDFVPRSDVNPTLPAAYSSMAHAPAPHLEEPALVRLEPAPVSSDDVTSVRDFYSEPDSGERTRVAESRELFLGQLTSLETIPEVALAMPADGRIEPAAVLLGRARGLRFRLALLEAWPENTPARSVRARDPRFLDALLDAAVLVVFAGARDLYATPYPTDAALLGGLCRLAGLYSDRATVREAGVAACARVTVLGPSHTLERLAGAIGALLGADRGAIGNAVATLARLAGPAEARAAVLSDIQRLVYG
ncbi:MAG: hypothetical protein IPJ34_04570 [Myxococcales bacterium]|nr:hypothetical protein [Myxococcales bacterium]